MTEATLPPRTEPDSVPPSGWSNNLKCEDGLLGKNHIERCTDELESLRLMTFILASLGQTDAIS
jgi:hypothetical protein